MQQPVDISLMPKSERRAARKDGITFHQCVYCGLIAKSGEPRPLRNPEG